MALIKCKECGKEISDKAARCVYCGCPIEKGIKTEIVMNENISSDSNTFIKDEKKTKMVPIIICILGLFLIIFLLSYTVSKENVLEPYNGDGVLVEIFYGEDCPPCQELKKYVNTLDSDFLESVEIKYYEVWFNEENANLMTEVAKMIGAEDEATSVPFVVFNREKYFVGFDDEKFINIINSYHNDNGTPSLDNRTPKEKMIDYLEEHENANCDENKCTFTFSATYTHDINYYTVDFANKKIVVESKNNDGTVYSEYNYSSQKGYSKSDFTYAGIRMITEVNGTYNSDTNNYNYQCNSNIPNYPCDDSAGKLVINLIETLYTYCNNAKISIKDL